jgi:hypothetical protein
VGPKELEVCRCHGMQLLAKNFIGDVSDCVGGVVGKLNSQIDAQEVQIAQLADMVNNLIRKTEEQVKKIKELQSDREGH